MSWSDDSNVEEREEYFSALHQVVDYYAAFDLRRDLFTDPNSYDIRLNFRGESAAVHTSFRRNFKTSSQAEGQSSPDHGEPLRLYIRESSESAAHLLHALGRTLPSKNPVVAVHPLEIHPKAVRRDHGQHLPKAAGGSNPDCRHPLSHF